MNIGGKTYWLSRKLRNFTLTLHTVLMLCFEKKKWIVNGINTCITDRVVWSIKNINYYYFRKDTVKDTQF